MLKPAHKQSVVQGDITAAAFGDLSSRSDDRRLDLEFARVHLISLSGYSTAYLLPRSLRATKQPCSCRKLASALLGLQIAVAVVNFENPKLACQISAYADRATRGASAGGVLVTTAQTL